MSSYKLICGGNLVHVHYHYYFFVVVVEFLKKFGVVVFLFVFVWFFVCFFRFFSFIEINYFIQQECIKLIRSDGKNIYNVAKDAYFK